MNFKPFTPRNRKYNTEVWYSATNESSKDFLEQRKAFREWEAAYDNRNKKTTETIDY